MVAQPVVPDIFARIKKPNKKPTVVVGTEYFITSGKLKGFIPN